MDQQPIEISNKVRNTGLLMLGAMLLVVGAWVFFVITDTDRAEQMISKSSVTQEKTQVSILDEDINVIEQELNALENELNYDLDTSFEF